MLLLLHSETLLLAKTTSLLAKSSVLLILLPEPSLTERLLLPEGLLSAESPVLRAKAEAATEASLLLLLLAKSCLLLSLPKANSLLAEAALKAEALLVVLRSKAKTHLGIEWKYNKLYTIHHLNAPAYKRMGISSSSYLSDRPAITSIGWPAHFLIASVMMFLAYFCF